MAKRPLSFWVQVLCVVIEILQKLELLFDCDDEDTPKDGEGLQSAA